jgi:hypothetical protein
MAQTLSLSRSSFATAKRDARLLGPRPAEELKKLAKAFGDRCPLNFVTPADLQEYCNGFRGALKKALAEFGAWLERKKNGGDEVVYDMDDEPLEAEFGDEEESSERGEKSTGDEQVAVDEKVADEIPTDGDDNNSSSEPSLGEETSSDDDDDDDNSQHEPVIEEETSWDDESIGDGLNVTVQSHTSSVDYAAAESSGAAAWRTTFDKVADIIVVDRSATHEDNTSPVDDKDRKAPENEEDEDDLDMHLLIIPSRTPQPFSAFPSQINSVITQLHIGTNNNDNIRWVSPRPTTEGSRSSQDSNISLRSDPSLLRVQRRDNDIAELEKYDDTLGQWSIWSLRILGILSGERFLDGYEDWEGW